MATKKQRVVFVNLHGNEFLVRTLDKMIFKRSAAVKHRYLLDYLLTRDDIEVCSYINRRGCSLSYSTTNPLLQAARFMEHRYVMAKNGIDRRKITVLKKESDLRPDDIVVMYRYYASTQLEAWDKLPDCLRVVCMIHYAYQPEPLRAAAPHLLYNESDLMRYSDQFRASNSWYRGRSVTIPFVPQPRFRVTRPFDQRQCRVFSTGTVTYMEPLRDFYGSTVAQPARKQIIDHRDELAGMVDCYNSDYLENDDVKTVKPGDNPVAKLYKRIYNKTHIGRQTSYFSFDMVEKFNEYKMCLVGEEIMGIPGIGFVEGMACGCAYIGQTTGYYEDYGMVEGTHYIGYDGTLADLKAKVAYWQRPENQPALARIAAAGQRFVADNFTPAKVAAALLDTLIAAARDRQ